LCLGRGLFFFNGQHCVWDGLCCFSVDTIVYGVASVVFFFSGNDCAWDAACSFSTGIIVFWMASVVFLWKLLCLVWPLLRFL